MMEDQRFAIVKKDPKFRRVPKAQSKIKIDKRFQSMFTDKKFQVKYSVDKRGRPVNHQTKEDLERYYEISSEEDSESSDEDGQEKNQSTQVSKTVKALKDSSSSENDSSDEDTTPDDDLSKETKSKNDALKPGKYEKQLSDDVKAKLKDLSVNYARGEQRICSESSSDDEESDEDVEEDEIDHRWGELDGDADRTEEATNRLAACNLDWDRIRAVDIMVLLNSFLPPGSFISSVAIYPSEFGKRRMKEEDVKGPIELVDAKKLARSNEEENEEGSQYHMEKLRQYQLNRLKYYYAVITFDSPSSANKVYTECDGLEYESTATKMDLRFIPDDMTFDDPPKESCDKLPEKYQPRFFTTSALQQAKVNLTWDETNPDRLEFAEKVNSGKIDDLNANDYHNFLAGSSSEEEEEDGSDPDTENKKGEDAVAKYKALLQDIKQKESKKKKDVELEISWGINLKEKTDALVKNKEQKDEEKTPFEKYIEKKKQKRKEKRNKNKKEKNSDSENETSGSDSDMPSDIDMNDEYFAEEFQNDEFAKPKSKKSKKKTKKNKVESDAEDNAELQLLTDDIEGDKKHFSFKKIMDAESDKKSKKNKKKSQKSATQNVEDSFKIDVEDNRFSALFTSHHYNIDPSDPHYKKTKAMETLAQEKLKRRKEEVDEKEAVKKPKSELNMLVKSVKRKANAFRNK